MALIRRSFHHYVDKSGNGGTWYHFLTNLDKFCLCKQPEHFALRDFVINTILERKVPDNFFHPEADRCCTEESDDYVSVKKPVRFKNIIDEALRNQGHAQRHYVVQKALVESPETNFVCAEIPVWCEHGERVGHMDLIEICQGQPALMIADLKPRLSSDGEKWYAQLATYRIVLAGMLKIPLDSIGILAFDNLIEEIAVL